LSFTSEIQRSAKVNKNWGEETKNNRKMTSLTMTFSSVKIIAEIGILYWCAYLFISAVFGLNKIYAEPTSTFTEINHVSLIFATFISFVTKHNLYISGQIAKTRIT